MSKKKESKLENKEENRQQDGENKSERKRLDADTKMRIAAVIFGVILILLLLPHYQANADEKHQVINFDEKVKIETVIGSAVANRIEVKGEELLEIVGDENQYKLKWNSNHRSIYLEPKVAVGEVIELSLLMLSGEVQDLRLTVGDVLARTIILSKKDDQASKFYDAREKEEITNLLRVMIKDKNNQNKYWVKEEVKKLVTSKTKQVTKVKEYRYGELTGTVIEIENKGKEELIITESEIKELVTNPRLMSFSRKALPAKEKAKVFIVSKEEQESK